MSIVRHTGNYAALRGDKMKPSNGVLISGMVALALLANWANAQETEGSDSPQ